MERLERKETPSDGPPPPRQPPETRTATRAAVVGTSQQESAPERVLAVDSSRRSEPTTTSLPGDERSIDVAAGRANAFAKLVRELENYYNSSADNHDNLDFLPLQLLQDLKLCGPSGGNEQSLAQQKQQQQTVDDNDVHLNPFCTRGTSSSQTHDGTSLSLVDEQLSDAKQTSAVAMRHTHSMPTRSKSCFSFPDAGLLNADDLYGQDGEILRHPNPLDIFQRSSSTPSNIGTGPFSSVLEVSDRRSAFTLPNKRASFTSLEVGPLNSAFDPVKYYATALEDMERTAIEVMDRCSVVASPMQESSPGADQVDEVSSSSSRRQSPLASTPRHAGAATRAARFLLDVGVLRRKRRSSSGRVNPAKPSSLPFSDDDSNTNHSSARSASNRLVRDYVTENEYAADVELDNPVTIITESDFNPNDTSLLSRSSEVSAIVRGGIEKVDGGDWSVVHDSDVEDTSPLRPFIQQDSDVDCVEQSIEAQLRVGHQGPDLSPSSPPLFDDRASPIQGIGGSAEVIDPSSHKDTTRAVTSSRLTLSPSLAGTAPCGSGDGSNLTPSSSESEMTTPGTSLRSCAGGLSSDPTIQAPSRSLSTISELDREVMEANKEGRRRRGLAESLSARKNDATDGASIHSSSTNSSNTNLNSYVFLGSSPTMLREGANVVADRFFVSSPTLSGNARTSSPTMESNCALSHSLKSDLDVSTLKVENRSADGTKLCNTSHSFDSCLHAETTKSQREGVEFPKEHTSTSEREGSPAEIIDYSNMYFEKADGVVGSTPAVSDADFNRKNFVLRAKPKRGPLRRFTSWPSKSPGNKCAAPPSTTPPPVGSISPLPQPQQLSPPKNMVDQPDKSTIARPFVTRKSTQQLSPIWGQRGASGEGVAAVSPQQTSPYSSGSSTRNSVMAPIGSKWRPSKAGVNTTLSQKVESGMRLVTPDKT